MLLTSFYPLMGGAEKQAQRLSMELINRGHKVTVLTRLSDKNLKNIDFVGGIEIIRLKVLKKGVMAPLSFLLQCIFYVLKNRRDIDIIHAHSLKANGFIAALCTKLFKIPSIAKIAGGGNENGCEAKRMYMAGGMKKQRLLFMKKHLNKFIAISNSIKKDLLDIHIPEEKIIFLPNGINIQPDNCKDKMELKRKLKLPLDKNIFLFAGRFEFVKGIDILLKAWNNTSNNFREQSILVLLGQGSVNIKNYSNEHSIQVMGKVDNVQEYMKAADFFVLPSRYEGISNALLEAIICKLPVIASKVGGNVDILDNNNGFIFNKDDDKALTKLFEEVITLDQQLLSNKVNLAYNKVKEIYDLNLICDKYEELYKKMI